MRTVQPKNRTLRIVVEVTVPGHFTEGDFLAALPQRDKLTFEKGEQQTRARLRYRRWSACMSPLAGIEAAAVALERTGVAFAITGTLRGVVRQLKGA